MNPPGIKVIKKAKTIKEFGILEGQESLAIDFIISKLSKGFQILLHNDEDEEGEGLTELRKINNTYEYKNSGHCWTGNWTVLQESELIKLLEILAPLNNGEDWYSTAKIRKG